MENTLAKRLRGAGFRLTAPRRAVLELLQDRSGQHLSAQDIHHSLRRRSLSVNRASVYRTLNLLVRLGLVHQQSLSETHAHFEIDHGGEIHLCCRSCGRVTETQIPEDSSIERELSRIARREGFPMAHLRIEIEGKCKRCGANDRPKKREKRG
jgi:Fur family ferric uptake transcriptional regulator